MINKIKVEGYHDLQFDTKRIYVFYNGIDRVDNNRGYEIENVVPCCTSCNSAKMDLSKEDFLCRIKRCYDNLFLKKLYNEMPQDPKMNTIKKTF